MGLYRNDNVGYFLQVLCDLVEKKTNLFDEFQQCLVKIKVDGSKKYLKKCLGRFYRMPKYVIAKKKKKSEVDIKRNLVFRTRTLRILISKIN